MTRIIKGILYVVLAKHTTTLIARASGQTHTVAVPTIFECMRLPTIDNIAQYRKSLVLVSTVHAIYILYENKFAKCPALDMTKRMRCTIHTYLHDGNGIPLWSLLAIGSAPFSYRVHGYEYLCSYQNVHRSSVMRNLLRLACTSNTNDDRIEKVSSRWDDMIGVNAGCWMLLVLWRRYMAGIRIRIMGLERVSNLYRKCVEISRRFRNHCVLDARRRYWKCLFLFVRQRG